MSGNKTVGLTIVLKSPTGLQEYLISVTPEVAQEIATEMTRQNNNPTTTSWFTNGAGIPFVLRFSDVAAILPTHEIAM